MLQNYEIYLIYANFLQKKNNKISRALAYVIFFL